MRIVGRIKASNIYRNWSKDSRIFTKK